MTNGTASKLTRGFEVEWIENVPRDEFGESDIDRAEYLYRDFANIEDARKFAKSVLPKTYFGNVLINSFEYVEYDDEGLPVFGREYGSVEEVID